MTSPLGSDGRPLDRSYLERGLPPYLREDIEHLKAGIAENCSFLDCLYDEVIGSINSAFWDDEISKEQAQYLRKKYLGEDDDRLY